MSNSSLRPTLNLYILNKWQLLCESNLCFMNFKYPYPGMINSHRNARCVEQTTGVGVHFECAWNKSNKTSCWMVFHLLRHHLMFVCFRFPGVTAGPVPGHGSRNGEQHRSHHPRVISVLEGGFKSQNHGAQVTSVKHLPHTHTFYIYIGVYTVSAFAVQCIKCSCHDTFQQSITLECQNHNKP